MKHNWPYTAPWKQNMTIPASEAAGQTRATDLVHEVVRLLAMEPDAPVKDTSAFVEDLGFDSLQLLELSSTIEEMFTVDPQVRMPKVVVVADLVRFIVDALAERRAELPTEVAAQEIIERL